MTAHDSFCCTVSSHTEPSNNCSSVWPLWLQCVTKGCRSCFCIVLIWIRGHLSPQTVKHLWRFWSPLQCSLWDCNFNLNHPDISPLTLKAAVLSVGWNAAFSYEYALNKSGKCLQRGWRVKGRVYIRILNIVLVKDLSKLSQLWTDWSYPSVGSRASIHWSTSHKLIFYSIWGKQAKFGTEELGRIAWSSTSDKIKEERIQGFLPTTVACWMELINNQHCVVFLITQLRCTVLLLVLCVALCSHPGPCQSAPDCQDYKRSSFCHRSPSLESNSKTYMPLICWVKG